MLFAERSSEVHFAAILIKTPTQENRRLPRSALLFPLCFDDQISTSHQFSPSNSNLCFTNNKEQEKVNSLRKWSQKPDQSRQSWAKFVALKRSWRQESSKRMKVPPNRSISRGRKAVLFFCFVLFFRNPKTADLARRARVQWENKGTYATGRGLLSGGAPKLLQRPLPFSSPRFGRHAGRGGRFKHPPPPPSVPRTPLGPAWGPASEQTPSSALLVRTAADNSLQAAPPLGAYSPKPQPPDHRHCLLRGGRETPRAGPLPSSSPETPSKHPGVPPGQFRLAGLSDGNRC